MEDYGDLAHEGYYGRLDLPGHLTKMVTEIMEKRGLSSKDLAASIYEPLGLGGPGSGQVFVNTVKSVHAHTVMPSPFRKKRTEKGRKQLYKISVLLHSLEVGRADPLVKRFSKNYPDFRYPPAYERKA